MILASVRRASVAVDRGGGLIGLILVRTCPALSEVALVARPPTRAGRSPWRELPRRGARFCRCRPARSCSSRIRELGGAHKPIRDGAILSARSTRRGLARDALTMGNKSQAAADVAPSVIRSA